MMPKDLDRLCIDTIRFLSVDAVQKANSGHPGMPLGAAPMAYVLWTRFLEHNPRNPDWFDRDRFVLSAGHGSMLLYSLLHLTGYDLPLTENAIHRNPDRAQAATNDKSVKPVAGSSVRSKHPREAQKREYAPAIGNDFVVLEDLHRRALDFDDFAD